MKEVSHTSVTDQLTQKILGCTYIVARLEILKKRLETPKQYRVPVMVVEREPRAEERQEMLQHKVPASSAHGFKLRLNDRCAGCLQPVKSPNYGTTSVQTLKFLRNQGGKANGGGPGLIVSPSREVHVPKYLVAEGLRNPHLEFSTKYSVLSSPRVPQLDFQPWAQLMSHNAAAGQARRHVAAQVVIHGSVWMASPLKPYVHPTTYRSPSSVCLSVSVTTHPLPYLKVPTDACSGVHGAAKHYCGLRA
ncbi:hypothetical protein CFIO01_06990 [Colletotrichum fioriniae PJ7]|uniref:Uncharacterized protein n=1 Tax=Colletotrichum fioriniae PJ7 TaxID=1445577 RepID=A0A010RXW8_9PEZI|nr:hypothetical protein CFIO01_06990 [Colletotrichum fioriniae PJ7]